MQSVEERFERLHLSDMLSVAQAAEIVGVGEDHMLVLIDQKKVFALLDSDCQPRLPRWCIESNVYNHLAAIRLRLTDDWQILEFLETPHKELADMPPMEAIMKGMVDSEWVQDMAYRWSKRVSTKS